MKYSPKDAVFTFFVFVAVCDIISHVGTNSLGRDVLAYCLGVRVHFLLQTTGSDLRVSRGKKIALKKQNKIT